MDRTSYKITKIINEWDPTRFIEKFYCPDDEYSSEIEMVKEAMKHTNSADELGREIWKIFTEEFGEKYFKSSLKECISIAQKILNE